MRSRCRMMAPVAVPVVVVLVVAVAAACGPLARSQRSGPDGRNGQGTTTPRAAAAPALPRRPLVRMAVAGDTGTGDAAERRTVSAMVDASRRYRYDAALLLGDLVYDVGNPRLVRRTVLRPFSPLTRHGTELVPALGNHDYARGREDAIMRRLGRAHRHYVDRTGPVRVVVLDSNRVNDRQTRWLRRSLHRRPAGVRWTIAIMHHSAYSAGMHGSTLSVRRRWSPLFARFGVPLVLAGHDHDYQRSRRIRGVTYVVSGAGAKTRPTGSAPFTRVSRSVRHFVDLAFYRHRLRVRAINQGGRVIDAFTLRR